MLKWLCRKTKERVRLGRIVLLENQATSRAYKFDFYEDLERVDDGLIADAIFEFIGVRMLIA